MKFTVKVSMFDLTIEDLEDTFDCVIVNDEAELLLLFKHVKCELGDAQKTVRYAIPLNSIESFSVEPIYEDNKQKISRC